MQKRKEITPELNIDRENEAIKELQVTFTKLHFPDLPLNDLVAAGKFATLARSSLEDDLHAIQSFRYCF
jgi:hypothetical protein